MISDRNCTTRGSITTLLHPFGNRSNTGLGRFKYFIDAVLSQNGAKNGAICANQITGTTRDFKMDVINDEISLSSDWFSSFDLSYKPASIFASHYDSSSSEKQFELSFNFFRNLTPIHRLRDARKSV